MNYRMQIQYDGARYRGWQRQAATGDTIQGKLEAHNRCEPIDPAAQVCKSRCQIYFFEL